MLSIQNNNIPHLINKVKSSMTNFTGQTAF